MIHVRGPAEWLFGDVKSFKAMHFKNNLKIGLSSVFENVYCVCANPNCTDFPIWKSDFRGFRADNSRNIYYIFL